MNDYLLWKYSMVDNKKLLWDRLGGESIGSDEFTNICELTYLPLSSWVVPDNQINQQLTGTSDDLLIALSLVRPLVHFQVKPEKL